MKYKIFKNPPLAGKCPYAERGAIIHTDMSASKATDSKIKFMQQFSNKEPIEIKNPFDIITECVEYPLRQHDDMVDAMAFAYKFGRFYKRISIFRVILNSLED